LLFDEIEKDSDALTLLPLDNVALRDTVCAQQTNMSEASSIA